MNYDNDISAEEIFQLTDALAQESDILQIIDKTMQLAQQACNADGVSYYTISDDNFLRLVYSHSRSLKIHKLGSDNKYYTMPTYLPDQKKVNPKTIIVTSALNQELINTPNIYANDYDNDIYLKWDDDMNYKTVSMLVIPIFNYKNALSALPSLSMPWISADEPSASPPKPRKKPNPFAVLWFLILKTTN